MSISREFYTLSGRVLTKHKRVPSLQVVRVSPSDVGPLVEWTGGPAGPAASTIEDGVTFRGDVSAQALLATIARFLACRWRDGTPVPSRDWDAFLARRHPHVFQHPPCSGPGWSWLWQAGAERIEEAGLPPRFRTTDTKEKYGGARWHYEADEGSDAVDEIIEAVEIVSAAVCEECGAPGMLRQGPWLKTLCTVHHEESRR